VAGQSQERSESSACGKAAGVGRTRAWRAPGRSDAVRIFLIVVYYILWLYLLLLIGRLIIDMLQSYSRTWRPSGILARAAEIIFTATDPPLRFLRRYLRPVRLGSVAFDLSYTLLFLVIIVLLSIVSRF
jgi:YggT family protein